MTNAELDDLALQNDAHQGERVIGRFTPSLAALLVIRANTLTSLMRYGARIRI